MTDTLYDETAVAAAASVIRAYSTSFGLATSLLGPRVRPHVRNVYALVRVADEIVDGAASAAEVPLGEQRDVLDALETETYAAIERGFSANLIVHAFARTARECGIARHHIEPFFASMRTDLERAEHDEASHDDYVYGSAEVVGLMCLQVFVNAGAGVPRNPDAVLVTGARRLGAAFQGARLDLDEEMASAFYPPSGDARPLSAESASTPQSARDFLRVLGTVVAAAPDQPHNPVPAEPAAETRTFPLPE